LKNDAAKKTQFPGFEAAYKDKKANG
jgi:hypothetical protein